MPKRGASKHKSHNMLTADSRQTDYHEPGGYALSLDTVIIIGQRLTTLE